MDDGALSERAQDTRGERRLAVCVDDFGLHEGVNAAVLELARRGLVSATGCLVDAPHWKAGAAQLRDAGDALDIDLGLHLDLTEQFKPGLTRWRWSSLVAQAYSGTLNPATVRLQVRAQLDSFEDTLGRAPDFVDGHRHVHQLPVVRDALVSILTHRYQRHRPWLRCTTAASPAGATLGNRWKALVIERLGSRALMRLAEHHAFPHNAGLLGVYGFDGDAAAYGKQLAAWLAAAGDGDLLMCHPAAASNAAVNAGIADPIAAARRNEYAVLSSDFYPRLLATSGVRIARLGGSGAKARSAAALRPSGSP
jgi:predicted glycoside hydrolase/deacetylase ChbG (UPF0249 family)